LVRYWILLSASGATGGGSNPGGPTQGNIVASAVATVKEILTHTKFQKCEQNNYRYLGHLGIMYGFLLLAIGTAIEIFMIYAMKTPLPLGQFTLPKLFGHVGFLALVAGLLLVMKHRFGLDPNKRKNTYQDWYLLIVLLVVAVTGQLLELVRYSGSAGLAFSIYFVHLVFVFSLIGYFPYSKFAHMFYRFVAILHAKYNGRDVTLGEAAA